ncbi:MAG: hypothetical protein LWX56_01925 [Ignavibacteria bacterium]|nr:hypothetical protein [Ignavibacteria bacterium]
MQKSVFSSDAYLKDALTDISAVKRAGFPDEAVPRELAEKYREREVFRVLRHVREFQKGRSIEGLHALLQLALWILLYVKIISAGQSVMDMAGPVAWRLTVYGFLLLVNVVMLLLIYFPLPYSYEAVLGILASLTIIGYRDTINSVVMVFFHPSFSKSYILVLLWLVNWVLAIVASWNIWRRAPYEYLRIARLLPQLQLEFDTDFTTAHREDTEPDNTQE